VLITVKKFIGRLGGLRKYQRQKSIFVINLVFVLGKTKKEKLIN